MSRVRNDIAMLKDRWIVLVAVLGVVMGVVCAAGAQHQARPNIVLIYADDLGYGDVGFNGATAVKTPNMDRIAAEGLRFTSSYAVAATCTPSRFSLLTGEYAWRERGRGILSGDAALIIQPGSTTLASVLKEAGYQTGVVGKWHLGMGAGRNNWNGLVKPGPNEVGFDYSFVMAATGDRVPTVYVKNGRVVGLDSEDPIEVSYRKPFQGEPTGVSDRKKLKMDWSHGHNNAVVNGIGRIGHQRGGESARWVDEDMAGVFTVEAVSFIERHRDKPFFLYFATHDIHVPRVPHERFVGQTEMGPRGDAIAQLDWQVGQVIKALDRLGLTENTIVIVTSDNGPVLDDGYKDRANPRLGDHQPGGPFRGGKYSVFEGGTRVPMVLRWPGRVRTGDTDAIVGQVDFVASFASLVGVELEEGAAPDSFDVMDALLGRTDEGREWIVQHAGFTVLREGDWKFIPGKRRTRDGLGPWGRVKIEEPGQLYNLGEDPGETRDLASKHPRVVEVMRAKLKSIIEADRTRPE